MCPHICWCWACTVGASNLSCVCELIGQGLRKMNEPIIVTNGEFLSNGLDNVEVWAGRCQRWAASFLWLIKILFKLGAASSMTSTLSLLTRSLSFFCSCTASGSGSSDLWRMLVKASQLAASAARSCFRFRVCVEITAATVSGGYMTSYLMDFLNTTSLFHNKIIIVSEGILCCAIFTPWKKTGWCLQSELRLLNGSEGSGNGLNMSPLRGLLALTASLQTRA